ncbi:50S ribosome-binding GTPase [Candidatus Micrarchaeota archaeon]|nr:50S ribosome-binding GTPase [Candidatus Micrarchaeota archaeon]
MIGKIVGWFKKVFGKRRKVTLGFYGAPNCGKTTLANKISMDWMGEPVGEASEIPHETRAVQKAEQVHVQANGSALDMTLVDMPGIATKVDYRDFLSYGMTVKKAQKRAKEAAKGIIEAIKWLEHVDAALVVIDASEDPYTQVNVSILGNLEAKSIPVVLVANKVDKKKADAEKVRQAFPQYKVVGVSALTGQNLSELYKTIGKEFK